MPGNSATTKSKPQSKPSGTQPQPTAAPPLKKKKKTNKRSKPSNESPCYFETLPLEILAEILVRCSSPKDLLAVARCSKHLCSTLVFEGNAFIWRQVRNSMLPAPMPEPLPHLTEPSYAALAFDGGPCDFCKKRVTEPFASYSLKVRFCFQSNCRRELKQCCCRLDETVCPEPLLKSVKKWYLTSESSDSFRGRSEPLWPTARGRFIRLDDLRTFMTDWNAAVTRRSEYTRERDSKSAWIQTHMEFYSKLYDWYQSHRRERERIKELNETFTRGQSSHYGWEYWDLRTCKSFIDLFSLRTHELHQINLFDFRKILGQINEEMIVKVENKRIRRTKEMQEKCARAIETHYNRLRSVEGKTDAILPNFAVFKALPVIVSLSNLSPDTKLDVGARLKSDALVIKLLKDEMAQWVERAKQEMAAVLGMPNWKSATLSIHPVERLNTRFLCIRCEAHRRPTTPAKPRSLTFKTACGHNCPHLEKHDKTLWSASWFKADTKAIDAISKVLPSHCWETYDPHTFGIVNHSSQMYACFSCKSAIFMAFQDIAEHAQRHDKMDFVRITRSEAHSILTHPLERGLTKKLLFGNLPSGKEALERKNFGCRHCIQTRAVEAVEARQDDGEAVVSVPDQPDADSTAPSEPVMKMKTKKKEPDVLKASFHGLRSHLKAKHGVLEIRDEDYFCYEPVESGASRPETARALTPQDSPLTPPSYLSPFDPNSP